MCRKYSRNNWWWTLKQTVITGKEMLQVRLKLSDPLRNNDKLMLMNAITSCPCSERVKHVM